MLGTDKTLGTRKAQVCHVEPKLLDQFSKFVSGKNMKREKATLQYSKAVENTLDLLQLFLL